MKMLKLFKNQSGVTLIESMALTQMPVPTPSALTLLRQT